MNEAEKMAQRLEERQSETVDGHLLARPADYEALEAAALIRSLDAQNKRMAEALKEAREIFVENWVTTRRIDRFEAAHADALRDAGVMP